jgi:hypothetical protein
MCKPEVPLPELPIYQDMLGVPTPACIIITAATGSFQPSMLREEASKTTRSALAPGAMKLGVSISLEMFPTSVCRSIVKVLDDPLRNCEIRYFSRSEPLRRTSRDEVASSNAMMALPDNRTDAVLPTA